MKNVTIVAVVEISDDLPLDDYWLAVGTLNSFAGGEVKFLSVQPGVTPAAVEAGADRTDWDDK